MFTIEKIANVPHPAIPQWRVYDRDRCVTLSVRILKSHNRSWQLYAEWWDNGKWTLIERVVPGEARAVSTVV